MRKLRGQGVDVLVTSRVKECAVDLLDALGVEHVCLSSQHHGGLSSMASELLVRNRALVGIVRSFRPSVLTGVGGIFAAQTGALTRTPSVIFYDTESARLQNALTYPFATRVVVPDCYQGWTPRNRTVRYAGCHELSYLHPDEFSPDREVAVRNGLSEQGDTFLLRLVSWKANHDLGEQGWGEGDLSRVIEHLKTKGKVLISSEVVPSERYRPYLFKGRPNELHHLMAHCRAVIGESATMASESAILGVPSLYVAARSQGRSYIDWLESRSGLSRHITDRSADAVISQVDEVTARTPEAWRAQRDELVGNCVSVSDLIVHQVLDMAVSRRANGS
ncbi:DUF354 domain-containing protein [Flagellatimonas centrodinii]|uniref:DUF354 domain-containing protein n=1 Tax=Flagellatimonas centrodinii TaxID=2806210 RepID=UPI001FED9CC2|nr:DUF354 domain-containing protein [Flagellatimonas centrodinii]ULQ48300.1 DUF354 domain-containing protein [Flagellatimonas centrodinii]